ncbi:MAG: CapA family protein, partial [Ruminococcus sp.]|nr:CapA family protein [Ruminococcus sp.]
MIGGDFCPHKEETFEKDKFSRIAGIISNTDYSIVNLECPIDVRGDKKPIKKIGPNLRASQTSASLLKRMGIKAVTLANNHFKDFGIDCCEDTFKYLSDNNIDYVGAGEDINKARKILFKEISDTTIAIINCCEEEFSIATEKEVGSNPINSIKQYYDIRKAKENADVVIVIIHGGIEMYNLPTPIMQERYRFFIDSGADLVVNHHQHCYSGMEWYKGKPIYYGLGNLYFPSLGKSSKAWNEGFMLVISINDKLIRGVETIPYSQSFEEGIILGDTFDFKESFNELSKVCRDPEELQSRYYNSILKEDKFSYKFLNPYNNRLLRG